MNVIRPPNPMPSLRCIVAAFALSAMLTPLSGWAIDVAPGDYVPPPVGTTAGLLYLQHAERNALYGGGSRVAADPQLTSEVGILRLIHYISISGVTVAPQILLPFGRLKAGRDIAALGKTDGVGDVILAAPVWVINEPSSGTYLGLTPYLFLPTGNYNSNRALNLGENRTKLNLQAGFVKRLSDKIHLDLTGDVMFYGKNDNNAGKTTLRQDRMYQLQGYLRYQYTAGTNVFLGLSQIMCGESRINGIDADDASRQRKFSVGASHFVRPTTQLMLSVGRDLKVENGFKEKMRLNLRLLQVI